MPSDQFVWLLYPERGLAPSDLWWVEYHHPSRLMRQFGRDQPISAACNIFLDLILLMWKSGMNEDNTLGMAFFYPWNSYHHLEMITLDGIRISHHNPARRDTRTYGQLAGTPMLQEVDDMTIRILEGPPSSLMRYTSVMRRVQTIFHWCMVSISGTLGCSPSQHDVQQTFEVYPSRRRPWEFVPEHGARGVKKGKRRLPRGRTCGGCAPVPPLMGAGFNHGGWRGGGFGGRGRADPG
ncbi:hypothetical protein M9H77_22243 [Catharanthus roseus]|uniref:Uncharacterized protein n=1 Tax=Catharanthus roseus TaxID=4058 RepID=A0ACC0APX7_CATRO|nr:hypothetical protein M9H77_22243 [Catharanthus roseus]